MSTPLLKKSASLSHIQQHQQPMLNATPQLLTITSKRALFTKRELASNVVPQNTKRLFSRKYDLRDNKARPPHYKSPATVGSTTRCPLDLKNGKVSRSNCRSPAVLDKDEMRKKASLNSLSVQCQYSLRKRTRSNNGSARTPRLTKASSLDSLLDIDAEITWSAEMATPEKEKDAMMVSASPISFPNNNGEPPNSVVVRQLFQTDYDAKLDSEENTTPSMHWSDSSCSSGHGSLQSLASTSGCTVPNKKLKYSTPRPLEGNFLHVEDDIFLTPPMSDYDGDNDGSAVNDLLPLSTPAQNQKRKRRESFK